MLPTEKAIQSRLKEVFDLKPTPGQWQNLISKAKGHNHSNSAPTHEFSLFSQPSRSLPKFEFREIIDSVTGANTFLIYPRGEE